MTPVPIPEIARPPPTFVQVRSLLTVLPIQSRRGDSNPQPPVYKTGALPIAPRRRTTVAEPPQRQVGLRNRTRSGGTPRPARIATFIYAERSTRAMGGWAPHPEKREISGKWPETHGHQSVCPWCIQAHTPSPAPRMTNMATTSLVATVPGTTPRTRLREPRRRDAPPGPHQPISRPVQPPTTSVSELSG